DDEGRENEGDMVLAAEHVTPEAINFMTRVAGGYLCLSLTPEDCDRLELHPQSVVNTSVRGTPFTVSIDGHPRHSVGTGISARDRATTIRLAIDPQSGPADFVRPGHINPLRSRAGGVLVRVGQTEGSVDLARLAGCRPAALIIEVVREDGEMARRDDLVHICREHGLKMCSVEQLIAYRLQRERLVRRIDPVHGTILRTDLGEFRLFAIESVVDPLPHLVLTVGDVGCLDDAGRVIESDEPTLVRMHRRDLLGDIFGDLDASPDGPTRRDLRAAMRMIQEEGRGAVVYLRPSGHGDAFSHKLTALRLTFDPESDRPDLHSEQGHGAAAVPMHQRDFGIGGQILRELGLSRLRLLTNRKKDLPGLEAFGLEIVEHVALRYAED
ncbi:MAG: 3,4-dihydroxy-2-butanone-4-phosphate synthase, partial [Phycisphaerales bacterium]|nr:3,4-dihydroxy-2-butanone-4-phosphate synthase [Phycisphaerales bacterium]